MMPRNGASSKCDVIVDLSGGDPLFGSHERRDGYFRVDMAKPGALADALFDASDLVGTFEKPLYVRYDPGICAHGRSGKVGCSNCIDACPVSAITPNGDTVAIDHGVCGGCGNCSASCPTGAVSYAFPMRSDVISRVQTLVTTFHAAGGRDPIILLHDATHGDPLIAACARYGQGLPAHVLPLSLYTTTHIGHDVMAGALASGAAHVVCLVSPRRRDEIATLEEEAALTHSVTSGLGDAQRRVHVAIEDDPDGLRDMLDGLGPVAGVSARTFTATPQKRETARLALTALHTMSSDAPEVIALPEASPYGQIHIDTAGCTLCLACVSACPANALADNPERPQVAFTEAACVQCGLCKTTCPEKVITLEPRFNFSSAALSPRVLNEEEPFECISCGKPFGTKSTIERVMAALAGKHSMFRESEQARVIQMCDDCRVAAMSELEAPMASAPRPAVRTTEDYLRADENDGDTPGSDTA
ncbi:MAG: 4Fe-4S binding protein [Pseudomonadota bacterium]